MERAQRPYSTLPGFQYPVRIEHAPEDFFDAYPVSTHVNRTANDNPKLVEPLVAGAERVVEPKSAAKPVKRPKNDTG